VTDTISGAGPLTIAGAITGSSTLTVSKAITANSTLSVSGTISGSSDISLTGTGTAADWVATSDKRLKENIQHLATQLDKVIEVGKQAISYNLKADDNKKRHLGFIAQDLEQIYPEFVHQDNTTEKIMSISYAKMVAPLYKAISELKEIVDKQQNQIDNLKQFIK
ncbi:MAG: tail fiber domain-containing protein, partial [Candidatus Heimdallarchaeota archaeon]